MTADAGTERLLLIGGAGVGKSTLLIQLFGRMQAGQSSVSVREAPTDLTLLRTGLDRLAQGLPVEHTPQSTKADQVLPTQFKTGEPVDIVVAEYAGEHVDKFVPERRIPPDFQARIQGASHWVFCVRLDRFLALPDLVSRPIAPEPGASGRMEPADPLTDELELPADLAAIELLQMLVHTLGTGIRGHRTHPKLTVLLTCWDELKVEKASPRSVLHERAPLLHDFVESAWSPEQLTVLGVSSQGQALSDAIPAEDFIDDGPESKGYLVGADGSHNSDLTQLIGSR